MPKKVTRIPLSEASLSLAEPPGVVGCFRQQPVVEAGDLLNLPEIEHLDARCSICSESAAGFPCLCSVLAVIRARPITSLVPD